MINLLSEDKFIEQCGKIKTAIEEKIAETKAELARIGAKLGVEINWLDDVASTLDDELTAINTELVDKGSTQADDFSEVAEKISDIETGAGGLKYATGTFTLTSSQFTPVINWNLDFLPSLVFVRPANATTEITTGIWGSYFILKKDYYTGEEISPFWVSTIRIVYYYLNGNFRSQTPSNGGIVKQDKLTLGYYTADAAWKPNVEYRWYAIEGAQE